jgi:hypothetical protein
MGYSITHYLRHFPLRYYLSGGLIRTNDPFVSLFLGGQSSVAMISRKHRVVGIEKEITEWPDAPPTVGEPPATSAGYRNFTAKLLSRYKAKGTPRFIFVPDFGLNDLYCNVHITENLRESNVENLLESLHEEPRQVIGSWDDPRPFRWALLNSGLEMMTGNIERSTAQVTIVGLPNDYCNQVESWVESQSGTLLAILPVSLACLKWFSEMIPNQDEFSFLILLLSHSILLAVVQNREVILLRQYEENPLEAYQEIPNLAHELKAIRYQTYVWSTEAIPEEFARHSKGTELSGATLQEVHGSPVQVRRRDGTWSETNEAVPHLLFWLEESFA